MRGGCLVNCQQRVHPQIVISTPLSIVRLTKLSNQPLDFSYWKVGECMHHRFLIETEQERSWGIKRIIRFEHVLDICDNTFPVISHLFRPVLKPLADAFMHLFMFVYLLRSLLLLPVWFLDCFVLCFEAVGLLPNPHQITISLHILLSLHLVFI